MSTGNGRVRVLDKQAVENAGRQPAVSAMLKYLKEDMMELVDQVRGNKCMTIRVEINTQAGADKVEKEVMAEPSKKSTKASKKKGKANAKNDKAKSDGNSKPDAADNGPEKTGSDDGGSDNERSEGKGPSDAPEEKLDDPLEDQK